MRNKLSTTLFLIALTFSPPAQAAMPGESAPDFQAKTTLGKDFSLAAQKGKIVVLEWSNPDCPFVHKHYDSGNMQALQKKYTGAGVVWATIVSSAPGNQGYMEPGQLNAIMTERGASPTYIIQDPDGKIGHLYGAKTTPHMFVINKDGTLAYAGAIDNIPSVDKADIAKATNYVSEAISAIEAGKPVSVATTSSYGCSVKY